MKQWNRIIFTIGVLASFCCVMSPFGGIAQGATAPTVTPLPVFRDGTVTPARMATDSAGNFYVADPHASGVLKLDSTGKYLKTIVTAKEPGGIAIDQNGRLLVTQGTYVVALNADGTVFKQFDQLYGPFKQAYAIAVDNRTVGGTGRIYVTDIQDYCVRVFDSSYNSVALSAHDPGGTINVGGTPRVVSAKPLNSFGASTVDYGMSGTNPAYFNRPAGIAFEKSFGFVAVVDSLYGDIQFFDVDGVYQDQFGLPGYSPTSTRFTYPQSIAFEYVGGLLSRAYVLDTFQGYVMAINTGTAASTYPSSWTRLSAIGGYGHANGNLISPTDILLDTKDPNNNRLLVSNGFGSISVFGLASLQPYNVNITNITDTSMKVNWTVPTPATSIKWLRVYRTTTPNVALLPANLVSGNLANTVTSFVDTSLTPYTTYYYTVRAVDNSSVEMPNIDQVFAKTTGSFGLTINVAGSGQVNGDVTCLGGTCSSSQVADSIITLTASPSGAASHFAGWSGNCVTDSVTCQVTMDAAKSVTASFDALLAFRVDGAYFDNLQDAYSKAHDGSVIQVMAGSWPSTKLATEYMNAWQSKTVIIVGGYNADFSDNTGAMSIITGRTLLSNGKAVLKQLKVQ